MNIWIDAQLPPTLALSYCTKIPAIALLSAA